MKSFVGASTGNLLFINGDGMSCEWLPIRRVWPLLEADVVSGSVKGIYFGAASLSSYMSTFTMRQCYADLRLS